MARERVPESVADTEITEILQCGTACLAPGRACNQLAHAETARLPGYTPAQALLREVGLHTASRSGLQNRAQRLVGACSSLRVKRGCAQESGHAIPGLSGIVAERVLEGNSGPRHALESRMSACVGVPCPDKPLGADRRRASEYLGQLCRANAENIPQGRQKKYDMVLSH